MQSSPKEIYICARDSALSKAQVQEVFEEFSLDDSFKVLFVKTTGDLDKKTSLKTLDKTNFFTKELDDLVLNGSCRIAVHSAKDLPDPLPKGLVCIKITNGIDASDSLVFRENETLKPYAKVGLSSIRRERNILALYPNAEIIDIRGTIEERLALLNDRIVDAVVIAEAALIRLKLTHLNRIKLEGEITPLQGKLAIVSRSGDEEMRDLFTYQK